MDLRNSFESGVLKLLHVAAIRRVTPCDWSKRRDRKCRKGWTLESLVRLDFYRESERPLNGARCFGTASRGCAVLCSRRKSYRRQISEEVGPRIQCD